MNKQQYKKKVDFLNACCVAYYEEGGSPISDEVYDQLYAELKAYEETNGAESDSPTQRVGSGSSRSL